MAMCKQISIIILTIFTLDASIAADIPRVKYYYKHYRHYQHRVKKEPILIPKEKPTDIAPTFDDMW